jgi:hypothetical protein
VCHGSIAARGWIWTARRTSIRGSRFVAACVSRMSQGAAWRMNGGQTKQEERMKQPQGRRLVQGIAALAAALLGLHAMADGPKAPPFQPPIPHEWTKVQNLETVKGADGNKHTATCSTLPGTNSEFHFWAKRGKLNNLVVFFEGGGACWDNLTCTFPVQAGLPPQVPQFYKPQILPTDDPRTYDGLFNLTDRANPVKDWSYVYIPYCTGDIHLGSNTKQYFNAGNPALPSTFLI